MDGIGNDLIREARVRRGLTQTQLAALVHTTQSAIARWEAHDTAPSFDAVLRTLRAMDFDLDLMLVERDDSDWIQASRMLELEPVARYPEHDRVVEQMKAFRDVA